MLGDPRPTPREAKGRGSGGERTAWATEATIRQRKDELLKVT